MILQKKLYIHHEDGCDPQLSLGTHCYGDPLDDDDMRIAETNEITIEAMAQMLDLDAESCNAHDFCGSHVSLAQLIRQELGDPAAFKIMRRLCNYRGLHGMEGVCGVGDPEQVAKELAIVR